MSDLRMPPPLSGANALATLRAYLVQLVNQLQYTLDNMEKTATGGGSTTVNKTVIETSKVDVDPQEVFDSIKGLIIKSGEIIEAVSEKVTEDLEGNYVVDSDFGTFVEETRALYEKTSETMTAEFKKIEAITSNVEALESFERQYEAAIRAGELEKGIYGIEIGQSNKVNGESTFDRFARFTSNRLSFYNESGNEEAYISNNRLHVTSMQVTETIKGNLLEQTLDNGDTVEMWIGG